MCQCDHHRNHAFEVRLVGEVSRDEFEAALGDVEGVQHEVRTVVRGRFADPGALYGLLRLVRSYGLEVVEIHRNPIRAGHRTRRE